MLQELTNALGALNSLSPLAVIALLGVVIYMLVKNQKGQETLTSNHLHELPEMAETLRRIEASLNTVKDNTFYIRARINGRSE